MKVDPRAQRFNAALSSLVLAVVLVTGSTPLLVAQAVVFGVSAVLGLKYAPYGALYRAFLRPFLGPPKELEDAEGPRFAQGVGLVVSVIGAVGFGTGVTALGLAGTAAALVAAFLNAVFGLCLGCELYVLIRRFWPARRQLAAPERDKEVSA